MEKISLNSKWLYLEDPDEKLLFENVSELLTLNKINKEMELPINWQLAGLNNFNGAVWFIKTLSLDSVKLENEGCGLPAWPS